MVDDLNPGGDGSRPSWLTVAGETLFMLADDGVHGTELCTPVPGITT